MSEKQKATHNAYCDYEVAKAKQPSRIYSVRSEVKRKPQGIKTYRKTTLLSGRRRWYQTFQRSWKSQC